MKQLEDMKIEFMKNDAINLVSSPDQQGALQGTPLHTSADIGAVSNCSYYNSLSLGIHKFINLSCRVK